MHERRWHAHLSLEGVEARRGVSIERHVKMVVKRIETFLVGRGGTDAQRNGGHGVVRIDCHQLYHVLDCRVSETLGSRVRLPPRVRCLGLQSFRYLNANPFTKAA